MKKNPVSKITLNINPDIVCQILTKAREFQAKEGVNFTESIDSSEYEYDPLQILADHKDDLTLKEVEEIIEDLEPDQQIELLALMYLGRGDYDVNEWSKAQKEAKKNLAPRLTDYLFSKPQISEYLQKGLELLGYYCDT